MRHGASGVIMGVMLLGVALAPRALAAESGRVTTTAPARLTDAEQRMSEARALLVEEDPARVATLSLRECLYLALYNNLDIAVQRLDPEAAAADVLAAEGAFDPELFLNYAYAESQDPQTTRGTLSTQAQSITETGVTLEGGVRGTVATGAEYEVSGTRTRTSGSLITGTGISHEYDVDASASVTQPLLRDFGIAVSTADIRIARRARGISEEQFARLVMETMTATHDAYWEVVRTRETLRVAIESVGVAADLLRQNQIRLEVGTMAPLEVLQAETGLASRVESLIVGRQAVQDAEDELKRLMNLPKTPAAWEVGVRPKEKPAAAVPTIELEAEVETALSERPELRAARLELENADIQVHVARNQMLPQLDATGTYGVQGINEDLGDAWDQADTPTEYWQVGMDASYPLLNREARGAHRRAELERMQQELTIRGLELSITAEVRSAVRAVQTAWERIQVNELARRLATEQLAAEQKKLEVGVSTSFDVLEFEEDLTQARSNAIAAEIDYQQALAALDLAVGRTLATHGITVDEEGRG